MAKVSQKILDAVAQMPHVKKIWVKGDEYHINEPLVCKLTPNKQNPAKPKKTWETAPGWEPVDVNIDTDDDQGSEDLAKTYGKMKLAELQKACADMVIEYTETDTKAVLIEKLIAATKQGD